MLDTAQLKKGDRCLYKRSTLIFQKTATVKGNKYLVFHTLKGAEKKISQAIASKEVWLEL